MGGIEQCMNYTKRGTRNGRQKVGKGRRMRREEQRAVFIVVEKSSKGTVYVPSLIKRPLNPGVKHHN